MNDHDNDRQIRVIGSHRPFARFGWTVVIEQPYDVAFAPVVSSLNRVAVLNLAIVLLVGLLASRIAGSIGKPLCSLSNAAKRLSDGERGVEIDETSLTSDEVNVLTRTFNEMSLGLGRNARELEEKQRAIESANSELRAKNEELSDVNLVLEQLSITDGLTKLHNHRYFQEAITKECKRSSRTKDPLCLILTDIPREQEQLTVSVGVAALSCDRRQLFADADAALYAAKDAGRNGLVIAPLTTDGSELSGDERAH